MGLARLDGNWAGTGVTGERFLEPSHPCARDLDLFGRGSIFELLCTARTRAGEEALARWLLAAAPPGEIRARQAAAIELRDRVAFRESLFITGEELELGVRPTHLIEWGEAEALLPAGMIRIVAPVLAAVWICNFLAWFFWRAPGFLLLASTIINLAYLLSLSRGPRPGGACG